MSLRLLSLLLGFALAASAAAAAPEMRRIPAGEAMIGSDRSKPDEAPAFRTRVAAFDLDRTEVTVAAFARFVQQAGFVTEAERLGSGAVMRFGTGQWTLVPGANWRQPLGPKAERAADALPVTQVSWNDATAYCAAAGKRLPSEVEYEYAAKGANRGGQSHAFGEQLEQGGRYRANVWTGVFPMINTKKDGYAATAPVGSYGEDALGLADLAGNVWEWTSDWYRPYTQRAQTLATAPASERVQRGGSFLCDPKVCYGFKASARGHATPDSSLMHVGFRCARSIARP